MMLEAMTALLSLPRVISHRLSRSRMTVTRKRFSCSSTMLPLMDPMAQHSVFRAPQLHSMPFSCAAGPREDQLRDPGTAEALQSPEAVSWLICHADGADVLAKHVQRAPAGTLRLRAAQSRHAWPRVSGLLDEMQDHQICTYASLRCMGLAAAWSSPADSARLLGSRPLPVKYWECMRGLPSAAHLQPELLQHLALCVVMVQVAEVHQGLVHGLIPRQRVCVLHRLAHDVSILVLHHDDLQPCQESIAAAPTSDVRSDAVS